MNNRGKATTYTNGRLPGDNSFATYPFFMGRSIDAFPAPHTSWFGVFYKNLAAQDWWVKSNKTSGEIDLETYAISEPGTYGTTQGVYIIISDADQGEFTAPEAVTAILHAKVLTGRHHFTPYWSLGWHQGE